MSRSPGALTNMHGELVLRLSRFLQDLQSAPRILISDRRFAGSAIVLIGLGVGLATTMFALMDAVTLRKLDVPDPDSLISITAIKEGRSILELVLKDTLRVVAAGAGAGLIATVLFAPLYRRFLFGVTAFEPSLLSAALGILLLCALGAALLPAWRATRLDPGTVLRADGE